MHVMGRYQHSIDAKNRLAIPARFREELGDTFTVLKAPDHCLYIYDDEGWSHIMEQIRSKSATAEDRMRQRKTYNGSFTVTVDKQGRITLPPELTAYAGLTKDVIVFGCDNRIEVWDKDAWDAMMSDDGDDDIADISVW